MREPSIFTKDKKLQMILDELERNRYAEITTNMSRGLGNTKIIKKNRKHIWIGEDNKKRTSMIALKPPLKVKKDGDRYFFRF